MDGHISIKEGLGGDFHFSVFMNGLLSFFLGISWFLALGCFIYLCCQRVNTFHKNNIKPDRPRKNEIYFCGATCQIRDKWVPVTTACRVLRLRMEERSPIWRVVVNLLNKQLRLTDKRWSYSLGVGRGFQITQT